MKVLVAEDEPVSRRLLQGHLERWGHEVVAVTDGARAWELFQQDEFFLVLTDWMMPEVDGLELIRRIRATPTAGYVFIILLTARSQKEDVVEGMDAGADDFVTKPFDRDELRVRLRAGERVVRLEHTLAEQNRALREAQAALVQTEKLASLGQLAAGVAHEINNPLTYVTNNLAVLRRDVPALAAVLDTYRTARPDLARVAPTVAADLARREEELDLDYIRDSLPRLFEKSMEGLQRVRDIVRNLRDFARLDEADFKEADLNAALASTLEILRHETRKKSLHVETAFGTVPPVWCHPGKINQVFLNVLMNAVQASSVEGMLWVRTRAFTADGAGPKPGVFRAPRGEGPREGVEVEVEDSAGGIALENLPRIFEPFFTTKPVGQGTGLGLSVSYGIVRDHGGVIEVETTPGRGSLFRIRLPVHPPRPDRPVNRVETDGEEG